MLARRAWHQVPASWWAYDGQVKGILESKHVPVVQWRVAPLKSMFVSLANYINYLKQKKQH